MDEHGASLLQHAVGEVCGHQRADMRGQSQRRVPCARADIEDPLRPVGLGALEQQLEVSAGPVLAFRIVPGGPPELRVDLLFAPSRLGQAT